MATSIDDNAADENLYKLFGEMSVIQYTSFISHTIHTHVHPTMRHEVSVISRILCMT